MHKEAVSLQQTYILSLDKVLAKKKGTTEEIERKLRMRIERQRDMGRAVRRVKTIFFNQLQSFLSQINKEHIIGILKKT